MAGCLVLQASVDTSIAQLPDELGQSLARGHALLIGISNYDKNSWPPLPSVAGDIDNLRDGLFMHFDTVETLLESYNQ